MLCLSIIIAIVSLAICSVLAWHPWRPSDGGIHD